MLCRISSLYGVCFFFKCGEQLHKCTLVQSIHDNEMDQCVVMEGPFSFPAATHSLKKFIYEESSYQKMSSVFCHLHECSCFLSGFFMEKTWIIFFFLVCMKKTRIEGDFFAQFMKRETTTFLCNKRFQPLALLNRHKMAPFSP